MPFLYLHIFVEYREMRGSVIGGQDTFLLVGVYTPAHQTNGFLGFALRLRGGNYAGARAYTYFDGCDYTINHAPHSRHTRRRAVEKLGFS